jgi:hypothetical protein
LINVGQHAFNSCTSLTHVNLQGLSIVKDSTFRECTKLESVNLGDVSEIGSNAFNTCTSLESMVLNSWTGGNNPSAIGSSAFANCKSDGTVITTSDDNDTAAELAQLIQNGWHIPN